MRYTFDETGSVIGFSTHYPNFTNGYWEDYLFAKNLQGDVVAMYLITVEPPRLIATYEYDEWGKVKTVRDATGAILTDPAHLANRNPFRYRSYHYDTETGFYYLQSRYYDPAISRFINADSYTATGAGFIGTNMYTYCNNNPVNRVDPSGHFGVTSLFVGALVCGVGILLTSCTAEVSYGAAQPFKEAKGGERSNSPNCYSYAIGYYNKSYNPGEFSGKPYIASLSSVASSIEEDMKTLGRSVRRLNSYNSSIKDNEYRIALRVKSFPFTKDRTGQIYFDWDYHFMVQTATGAWAEKHGPGGDALVHEIGETPETISWDRGNRIGYYDSEIIYFAISN